MVQVGRSGLFSLISRPISTNVSQGLATMPSSPMRIACRTSVTFGGNLAIKIVSRAYTSGIVVSTLFFALSRMACARVTSASVGRRTASSTSFWAMASGTQAWCLIVLCAARGVRYHSGFSCENQGLSPGIEVVKLPGYLEAVLNGVLDMRDGGDNVSRIHVPAWFFILVDR